MVFSTLPFIYFFLPAFFLLYFTIPGRAKNLVLLVFSLIFYAWGEPVYILLMLLSSFVDYMDGILQERFGTTKARRRLFLALALLINLSLLAYFKYADFAVSTVNTLFHKEFPLPGVALPIGISFYTFQTVSYSIDVYRKKVRVEHNYFDYLTYVCMFPQLIAGPIVRFTTVQEEIKTRTVSRSNFECGLMRFLLGLFRKVLIANQIGELWESLRTAQNLSVAGHWLGLLCFTLQLYYDFSAYSDMAIGLGRMMGFHFPENFIYPLSATSITEFWRRWHISLSGWFRDYVYIPLGGNRVKVPRHLFNLLAVWFLTGLWHGASWNYVLWGLFHCFFLILEKYVYGGALKKLPRVLRHLYAVFLVVVGFGIFVFEDMTELKTYFAGCIGAHGEAFFRTDVLWYAGNHLPVLAAAIVLAFPFWPWLRRKLDAAGAGVRRLFSLAGAAAMVVLFIVVTAGMVADTYNPFLYFRF